MARVVLRTAVKEKPPTTFQTAPTKPQNRQDRNAQAISHVFQSITRDLSPWWYGASGRVTSPPIRRRVDGLLLAACFAKRLESGGKTETIGFWLIAHQTRSRLLRVPDAVEEPPILGRLAVGFLFWDARQRSKACLRGHDSMPLIVFVSPTIAQSTWVL